MTFDSLWSSILDVGRDPGTGGYRRFAWTAADLTLREWFAGEAQQRGMTVEEDRNGNVWAWWMPTGWAGDPVDAFVTGSHLDSVPEILISQQVLQTSPIELVAWDRRKIRRAHLHPARYIFVSLVREKIAKSRLAQLRIEEVLLEFKHSGKVMSADFHGGFAHLVGRFPGRLCTQFRD